LHATVARAPELEAQRVPDDLGDQHDMIRRRLRVPGAM